jgi:hypothetical protein
MQRGQWDMGSNECSRRQRAVVKMAWTYKGRARGKTARLRGGMATRMVWE